MIWKKIPGYDGYKVSDHGDVLRVKDEVIMTKVPNHRGYYRVNIKRSREDVALHPFVHNLVARAFLPNPNNYKVINHKDLDKKNNHVENLEWCSMEMNVQHAYENGAMAGFKINPNQTKLTREQIIEIRETKIGMGDRKLLCERFGVSIHVIKDIRSGRSWANIK